MTKPVTATFGKFKIMILDEGGDPTDLNDYTAPCGLVSKGFTQTNNTQETVVPDCDDEDAPAQVERAVDSQSREISGSGSLAMGSRALWQDFYDDAAPRTCRIILNLPLAQGGGYWQGDYILANFNVTGSRGKKCEAEITLQSDGATIWTNADA